MANSARRLCLAALPIALLAAQSVHASGLLLCRQPPTPSEIRVSSEYNIPCNIISEVANDCYVSRFGVITKAVWWTGPIGAASLSATTMYNLRFYKDNSCQPGTPIAEYLGVNPLVTVAGVDSTGASLYRCEYDVSVPVSTGKFWFGAQMIVDMCPPQGGRGGDGGDGPDGPPCGCAYRSPTSGYPNWTPVSVIVGRSWEASQEFEIAYPVPIDENNWGALKALYR
jgi:hypothetical protein